MGEKSLDRQVVELTKLLTLWPQLPTKTAIRYIQDTLGVTMTRVCLQEAKSALDLTINPEYVALTRKKRAFVEGLVMVGVQNSGFFNKEVKSIVREVAIELRKQFDQQTHHRLVTRWVSDTLDRLTPVAGQKDELGRLVTKATRELQELGLIADTRQTSLL